MSKIKPMRDAVERPKSWDEALALSEGAVGARTPTGSFDMTPYYAEFVRPHHKKMSYNAAEDIKYVISKFRNNVADEKELLERVKKTYSTWTSMFLRVRGSTKKLKERYTDRGITVDSRWDTFRQFVEDMGLRPPGKILDRENNNGNYCRENCRWATHKQNAYNAFYDWYMDYRGQRISVGLTAKELNIHPYTLAARIRKNLEPDDVFRKAD